MVPLSPIAPPSTVIPDCARCDEHYLPIEVQTDAGCRYQRNIDNLEAQQSILQLKDETVENLKHVRDLLLSHGDVILSRWKKYSREKRAKTLRETCPELFDLQSPYPDTKRRMPITSALVKWLDIASFSQDYMKLVSLLHVRTAYEPHLWAAFDTRTSWNYYYGPGDQRVYNAAAVVMQGDAFGTMVDFDADSAHSWEMIGFPRAFITFNAQYKISNFLKEVVQQISFGANGSGNSNWMSLLSKGLHSAHNEALWSSYQNQEFAPPAQFDPKTILEKARDHLDVLVDEVELMQTDPEQMYLNILDMKASIGYQSNAKPDEKWAHIAHNISIAWTNEISKWQRIVAEADNLKTSFAVSQTSNAKGTRLTKDVDTATKCFGATIRSWLTWEATVDFQCLHSLGNMKESFETWNSFHEQNGRSGKNVKLWNILDPNKQNDRILMSALNVSRLAGDEIFCGVSMHLQSIRDELGSLPYSKHIEHWLSGIALLDELYISWYGRQMTDYHIPPTASALKAEIRSRDMLPYNFDFDSKESKSLGHITARDVKTGQLMRAFSGKPLPKGAKNLSWLKQMTEARQSLSELWDSIRTDYDITQRDVGRSEAFRTSVLSRMSFDKSPAYLAKVEAERQRIEEDDQRVESKTHQEARFVRQTWDLKEGKDDAVRRTLTKKTNASRNETTISDRLGKLTLSEGSTTEHSGSDAAPATVSQIAVRQDTLSVISKMFPTGADGSSGVRWSNLMQALADAGLTITQGAGSAVSFANEHGSISIHKPHDSEGHVVDAITMRGLGKRFNKWFGWQNSTFVLREKGDSKTIGEDALA